MFNDTPIDQYPHENTAQYELRKQREAENQFGVTSPHPSFLAAPQPAPSMYANQRYTLFDKIRDYLADKTTTAPGKILLYWLGAGIGILLFFLKLPGGVAVVACVLGMLLNFWLGKKYIAFLQFLISGVIVGYYERITGGALAGWGGAVVNVLALAFLAGVYNVVVSLWKWFPSARHKDWPLRLLLLAGTLLAAYLGYNGFAVPAAATLLHYVGIVVKPSETGFIGAYYVLLCWCYCAGLVMSLYYVCRGIAESFTQARY